MNYNLQLVETQSNVLANIAEKPRKSSLMAPEVSLNGHEGAVYSINFDPSGRNLCSASMDRQIFLWNIFDDCKNYNVLSGHKSAVLEAKWLSETAIVSCSADKTVAIWDANSGKRVRKLTNHTGIVNSISVAKDSTNLVVSGSDDCTAILWDIRSKEPIATFYHEYQVLATAVSADGGYVFTGGIDYIVRRFDSRLGDTDEADLSLVGHHDSVTGLAISPNGNQLLSNAMDSSLRCWDIRPFATSGGERCEHVIKGNHHGAEKLLLRCAWSANGEHITCGSADRLVHIWETTMFNELYNLPGHKASVNDVIFHPFEPLLASCSSDKTIILGEISV